MTDIGWANDTFGLGEFRQLKMMCWKTTGDWIGRRIDLAAGTDPLLLSDV